MCGESVVCPSVSSRELLLARGRIFSEQREGYILFQGSVELKAKKEEEIGC